jgi:hypothetical protein
MLGIFPFVLPLWSEIARALLAETAVDSRSPKPLLACLHLSLLPTRLLSFEQTAHHIEASPPPHPSALYALHQLLHLLEDQGSSPRTTDMIMRVWYGHPFVVTIGMQVFDELLSIGCRNDFVLLVVQEERWCPALFC